jgi:hypothetical protein
VLGKHGVEREARVDVAGEDHGEGADVAPLAEALEVDRPVAQHLDEPLAEPGRLVVAHRPVGALARGGERGDELQRVAELLGGRPLLFGQPVRARRARAALRLDV